MAVVVHPRVHEECAKTIHVTNCANFVTTATVVGSIVGDARIGFEGGVCRHLKYVEFNDVCCRSLSELRGALSTAKERLRHNKHAILCFIRQPSVEV